MTRDLEQEARNKALVLEAFDALFNRRDFEAAERYWSPDYVQHSAAIGPGWDGILALVRSVRRRYENALALAEGEYVVLHGRFSGGGRPTIEVVDIVRVEVRQEVTGPRRRAPRASAFRVVSCVHLAANVTLFAASSMR